MTQYRWGYYGIEYRRGYFEGTLQFSDESTVQAVAAAYPQSTLNGTLSLSSFSGTVSYETYLAGQEESGCVLGRWS